MIIKTPLYVGYKVSENTEDKLNNLLGFKKDFNDKYHCTILYSKKEVSVDDALLDRDIDIPMFTGVVKDYTVFESKIYGKSFVLKLDCEECVNTHNRLMSKYNASFDYPEYVAHVTLMYDLPDNIDREELFNKFKDLEITFDKIRYEKFNNEKYKDNK
jgi:hypothetical protein